MDTISKKKTVEKIRAEYIINAFIRGRQEYTKGLLQAIKIVEGEPHIVEEVKWNEGYEAGVERAILAIMTELRVDGKDRAISEDTPASQCSCAAELIRKALVADKRMPWTQGKEFNEEHGFISRVYYCPYCYAKAPYDEYGQIQYKHCPYCGEELNDEPIIDMSRG